MNLQLFCSCGAAWWIIAEGERAIALVADWIRQHGLGAGPGHAPCSAVEARWARLRYAPILAYAGRVTGMERQGEA